MSVVITFEDFTPSPRFDNIAWEDARIEEAPEQDGPWTTIDTIALSPVDVDPSDPASRNFTTSNGTDTGLWYRIIFVDGNAAESQPTIPLINTQALPDLDETPYADENELARILKIRTPTAEQTLAMTRVLSASALEINAELGRSEPFSSPPPALVVEVNLERAVEHWQQEEAAFGIIGLGTEAGGIVVGRDSWDRHAHKLAPLKESWGLA